MGRPGLPCQHLNHLECLPPSPGPPTHQGTRGRPHRHQLQHLDPLMATCARHLHRQLPLQQPRQRQQQQEVGQGPRHLPTCCLVSPLLLRDPGHALLLVSGPHRHQQQQECGQASQQGRHQQQQQGRELLRGHLRPPHQQRQRRLQVLRSGHHQCSHHQHLEVGRSGQDLQQQRVAGVVRCLPHHQQQRWLVFHLQGPHQAAPLQCRVAAAYPPL